MLLGVSACAPDSVDEAEPKTYEAVGTIVSVEGNHVLIDHEDIPGFMDAMTMTFPVPDASILEGLEKGMRVNFRVVVDGASYEIVAIESVAPE